jgi:DNA-binding transcriptional LysR family regulator
MGTDAKYVVRLSGEERQSLEVLVATKRVAACKSLRARMLLKADVSEAGPRWTDEAIAAAFEVSLSTVHRLRQQLVEEGLDAALMRKPRTPRPPKLDGEGEARLLVLACSEPPAGRARWTLQLLADKLVELRVVDSLCGETVRLRLKKTKSNLGCVADG